MALDVYVGTMTRYYRREWENVAQRLAREQGIKYQIIHPGGQPQDPLPANEIREAVDSWSQWLSRCLKPDGIGPVIWDEGCEKPYSTDRPSWDGYTALRLWAAYSEHADLAVPVRMPKTWTDDPAYKLSTDKEYKSAYRTILEPQLWLPIEFPFVFDTPTVVSDEPTCIGSVFTLQQQLDRLRTETSDRLAALVNNRESELAVAASAGMAVFRTLAAQACEHRLPMLLDF